MDVGRFRADLYELAQRACAEDSHKVREKVLGIADILVMLYRKKLVKINHSALELVCGRGLILKGYDVKVEHRLDDVLVCDVFGTREDGQLIVEIETGFIPPEAALEPSAYAKSRIASKIARYSRFAGRFALGTTPSYVLDFPEFFVKPRRLRTAGEALKIKALTDVRYTKPSISIKELMDASLESVLIIDVDSGKTQEMDPQAYSRTASSFLDHNGFDQGLNRHRPSRGRGFKVEKQAD